jgi:pimeloyl-ACP methyl ester carboxylesterase
MPPFAGEPPHWQHHTAIVSEPAVKLASIDVAPTAGTANGHVLVLLHGYPSASYAWRHVVQPFADLGYRVVAPDYRGAGDSNKPNTGYDKVTMAKDVHSLFRDHLGVKKAIVVGYDIGMMVAVSLALQFPGSVEGLVGFDPFFFLPSLKYPSDLRLPSQKPLVPGTKA